MFFLHVISKFRRYITFLHRRNVQLIILYKIISCDNWKKNVILVMFYNNYLTLCNISSGSSIVHININDY